MKCPLLFVTKLFQTELLNDVKYIVTILGHIKVQNVLNLLLLCFDVSDQRIKVTVGRTSKIIFWKCRKLANPWQKITSF